MHSENTEKERRKEGERMKAIFKTRVNEDFPQIHTGHQSTDAGSSRTPAGQILKSKHITHKIQKIQAAMI